MAAYEFGPFRLTEDELKRNGRFVPLDPQPLAVLHHLIRRRPALVSKEELLEGSWKGVVTVSVATIHKAVSRARAALGDTGSRPKYIETVPRRGYRFIAPVTEVEHLSPVEKARSVHTPGDRARFVRDLTIPDGSIVKVGQRFVKRWEIKNVGTVPWVKRSMARLGPAEAGGRLSSPAKTPVPGTRPGQSCIIEVELTAPSYPGSCYAEWKMVNASGRFCLPRQKGLYVSVDVKE